MKLTTLEVSKIQTPSRGANGKSNEDRKGRETRMKGFWQNQENANLYNLGKLLSVQVDGKSLATLLIEGKELELDAVTAVNGTVLPLVAGFKLSLSNLKTWGCPACHSAHGTGTYPSREADAELLAGNEFYYNPKTKHLFTISKTCWGDYVKGLGAASRFTEVPEPKPVKTTAKAQQPATASV